MKTVTYSIFSLFSNMLPISVSFNGIFHDLPFWKIMLLHK